MRVRFSTTVILLLAICAILCGCGALSTPLGKAEIPNNQPVTYLIYVCGAVEIEGYYEVEAGMDYSHVLMLAGRLPQSVMPLLSTSYVDGQVKIIIVGYYENGINYVSINANSILIATRNPVEGLSDDVVNKLADYIDTHGKIANKHQLSHALGEDYAENHYKLFISLEDYEEVA